MKIGNREVFPIGTNNTLICAELGLWHEGSLARAARWLASLSLDVAVKFQYHDPLSESSYQEQFRDGSTNVEGETRLEYWRRTQFSPDKLERFTGDVRTCGVPLIASTFSKKGVDDLERYMRPDAYKVASGVFFDDETIDAMLKTGRPLIISTGLAGKEEIFHRVRNIAQRAGKIPLAVLYCHSQVPSYISPKAMTEGAMALTDVTPYHGFSDHSGSTEYAQLLLSFRPSILEVHVQGDHSGPDGDASLDFDGLERLCTMAEYYQKLDRCPIWPSIKPDTRKRFTKSVALRHGLTLLPGDTILASDLVMLKPGGGFKTYGEVIGRKVKVGILGGHLIKAESLE